MSGAYYNEIDPGAAQWLRNLIKAGLIAAGEVDERSIEDIRPDEIRGFTQVHFFAGIGIWSYALRRAGWDDTRPVWTGSCPCQPFSAAGKGAGFADERHLWPAWFHLIDELRPSAIFGEQVASKDADPWIDLVQADLEAVGYAVGAIPFPSAGIGAPHIRDRLYWVANANERRRGWRAPDGQCVGNRTAAGRIENAGDAGRGCSVHGLALAEHGGCKAGEPKRSRAGTALPSGAAIGLANADHDGQQPGRVTSEAARYGDTFDADGCARRSGPTNGFWRDADWLGCRDGKWRPVEPSTFPLAHGAASRVVRLRAYGNAINAEAAQAMIEAYLQTEQARNKLAEESLEQAA
jgi:DNA (cytosine-5)-methyltransferase 1